LPLVDDDDINTIFNLADDFPAILIITALIAFDPVDIGKYIQGIVKPNIVL